MNSSVAASYPMMTSSNKLRTYSTARFFLDDEIVRRLVYGLSNDSRSGKDPNEPVHPVPGHAAEIKLVPEHRVTK
jgi:hypothetical protein